MLYNKSEKCIKVILQKEEKNTMNILETLKNSINSLYVKYLTDKGIVEEPIFYIAGAQTLPPPLPEEEERYYIQKLSEKK